MTLPDHDARQRSARLRGFFARYATTKGGAQDPRVEQAFAAVPREPFAGPAPWSIHVPGNGYLETPDDDPAYLYQDVLVALDPTRGINIGEPSLHARCLDALAPGPGETILHVGAGAGYYSAILAHLVGAQGRVLAYEIDPDLAARARRNLSDWPWAEVRARSGIAAGLPEVDGIYVSAGLTQPAPSWLDALRPGGRLLFPLQPLGGFGGMLLVRRPGKSGHATAWPARFICTAGFIGCIGPQDEETGRRLREAFTAGGWRAVRALRLDDAPDETCWVAGDGWWLSTAEPPAD